MSRRLFLSPSSDMNFGLYLDALTEVFQIVLPTKRFFLPWEFSRGRIVSDASRSSSRDTDIFTCLTLPSILGETARIGPLYYAGTPWVTGSSPATSSQPGVCQVSVAERMPVKFSIPSSIPKVKQHMHLYTENSKSVLLPDRYHMITETSPSFSNKATKVFVSVTKVFCNALTLQRQTDQWDLMDCDRKHVLSPQTLAKSHISHFW